MKNKPAWLETLWSTNPSLAEKAEKYLDEIGVPDDNANEKSESQSGGTSLNDLKFTIMKKTIGNYKDMSKSEVIKYFEKLLFFREKVLEDEIEAKKLAQQTRNWILILFVVVEVARLFI